MVSALARLRLGFDICLNWLATLFTLKTLLYGYVSKPTSDSSEAAPEEHDQNDGFDCEAQLEGEIENVMTFDEVVELEFDNDDDEILLEGEQSQVQFDWNCLKAPGPERITDSNMGEPAS